LYLKVKLFIRAHFKVILNFEKTMKTTSPIQPIRRLAAYLIICTGLIFQSSLAMATPEKARDFVQGIGDKVIGIVATGNFSDNEKEKQLNRLFAETVDINWIAKFVVGRYWREASGEQQGQYIKFYNDFLIRSYVSKFRQYTDQKMVVNKFTAEEEGKYIVETTIIDKEGKSYNVFYKVNKMENGSLKIYDIVAEGVSMITTQRSEFASILSREGMDALIRKLQQKS